jgi:hypothetical protein
MERKNGRAIQRREAPVSSVLSLFSQKKSGAGGSGGGEKAAGCSEKLVWAGALWLRSYRESLK